MVSFEKLAGFCYLALFYSKKGPLFWVNMQTLLQKLLSPHCLALAMPFLCLCPQLGAPFLSVPHSILISTVRVCCICKDLGRGSQCPCWRFLVGQGACTFFVCVHSSVSVHWTFLPSQQSHCYMIRNGKEVILTVFIKRDKENNCIFHIFLPLDSFLGLSCWYLIYFGGFGIAQPTHSYRKPYGNSSPYVSLLIFSFLCAFFKLYYCKIGILFTRYFLYLRPISKEKRPT